MSTNSNHRGAASGAVLPPMAPPDSPTGVASSPPPPPPDAAPPGTLTPLQRIGLLARLTNEAALQSIARTVFTCIENDLLPGGNQLSRTCRMAQENSLQRPVHDCFFWILIGLVASPSFRERVFGKHEATRIVEKDPLHDATLTHEERQTRRILELLLVEWKKLLFGTQRDGTPAVSVHDRAYESVDAFVITLRSFLWVL